MTESIRNHFPTVYVTVASVLLGLALEDLVSVIRDIEHRDAFVWISSVFIVHIIMNAWIGYSSVAIAVALEPNPWDALNIFVLSGSHFALNSFVGAEPASFFLAAAAYSLTGGGVTYYNSWRAAQDPLSGSSPAVFRRVISLNFWGAVVFLCVGALSSRGVLSEAVQLACLSCSIPFATLWLIEFWRAWSQMRGFSGVGSPN